MSRELFDEKRQEGHRKENFMLRTLCGRAENLKT